MSTKDFCLSTDKQKNFVDNTSSGQYSNLNLNQNYHCSNTNSERSKQDTKKCQRNFEKKNQPKDTCENQNNLNTINNSTLSLHIAAYENSIDETPSDSGTEELKEEKFGSIKNLKQSFIGSRIQNPFEFPRQQKGIQVNEPEVMQFVASQKLRNPNKSLAKSQQQPPSSHLAGTSQMATKSKSNSKINNNNKNKNNKIEPPLTTKMEESSTAAVISETNIATTNTGYTNTDASIDYTIVKGNSGRTYRVYNVIGKGGYGVVHKCAYEMKNGQFLLLAIKSESTESLDVEVKVLLRMKDGTHFCSVFDEGFDPYSQTRFMVMTLVGENLSSLRRQFGYFSWGTVLRVGIQVSFGIR
uniref:Protein kinase domain-containing protein n=1 Tax=Panagrolaimus sp. ES5 TaxID=591445 RepID=A0AC34F4M8_9BILA